MNIKNLHAEQTVYLIENAPTSDFLSSIPKVSVSSITKIKGKKVFIRVPDSDRTNVYTNPTDAEVTIFDAKDNDDYLIRSDGSRHKMFIDKEKANAYYKTEETKYKEDWNSLHQSFVMEVNKAADNLTLEQMYDILEIVCPGKYTPVLEMRPLPDPSSMKLE